MKLLMLKVEESMINDDNIEMKKVEHSINISIMIDQVYNVIIYDECEIELSFEWIMNHLKDNHGVKTEMIDVMKYLNMMKSSMMLKEVKE